MPEEIDYFNNKRTDRTYISKAIEGSSYRHGADPDRLVRIVSKVFDSEELHRFVKVKDEVILHSTPAERQEVRAVFYEDTRDIHAITLQKFTKNSGLPHKLSFTFRGSEIETIYSLLHFIQRVELDGPGKVRFDDQVLNEDSPTVADKRRFLLNNEDIVIDIAENDITKKDITALAYRKNQLKIFDRLLREDVFFESTRREWNAKGKEAVWQKFFEKNSWIFGYGLNYIFTSALDGKKLEQVTTGYSVSGSGKRVDALMKTRGFISSLCFVEIKTHLTPLLSDKGAYRPECWRISDELAGSVAQIQKTVHKAVRSIESRIEIKSDDGDPTGEIAFLYQPRAFIVIGSLSEFQVAEATNEQKFSSFELFRRNITDPEIVTFDELYERAKFIVQHSETESPEMTQEEYADPEDDDLPF